MGGDKYDRTVGPPTPTFPETFQLDRNSLASVTPPRRTENRIPKRMLVRLSYPEKGESEIAPTVDISCHGARVISKGFWQPNIRLSVHSISGDLYSRARVVHCQSLANASWVIGLELFQPSGDWTKFSKAP
jgi:hypothetical protein